MQCETYDKQAGRRVRLTASERDQFLATVRGNPKREIAYGLMAHCGLRSQEVVDVRPVDIHTGDETECAFLRVRAGKGNKERQTPIPDWLVGKIEKYAVYIEPTDSIINLRTRALRRWVTRSGDQLAEETGDERWRYMTPHDLRRTWGHLALEAEVLPSVLMQWGGWEDYDTFKKHYLGRHSERIQAREASKVSWL